jgi:hypothetical protein
MYYIGTPSEVTSTADARTLDMVHEVMLVMV